MYNLNGDIITMMRKCVKIDYGNTFFFYFWDEYLTVDQKSNGCIITFVHVTT